MKPWTGIDAWRYLSATEWGPLDHHILRHYWNMLTIVDRVGGYYGAALRSFQGLNQGHML